MAEVKPADGCRRGHRVRLGQVQTNLARAKETEQPSLFAVIGARRITKRGPDTAVLLGDQIFVRQVIFAGEAPIPPRPGVQVLRKRLRETIGQGFDDDR